MKSTIAKLVLIAFAAHALPFGQSVGATEEGGELPGELAAFAALGYVVGDKIHLNELGWTEAQFEAFALGLRRHFMGAARVELGERSNAVFLAINKAIEEAQTGVREEDASVVAIKGVATKLAMESLPEGGFMRILVAGSGARPRAEDTIVVSLSATAVETGEELSGMSLKSLRTRVSDLLPGLGFGIQRLTIGSEAIILVPPDLSFGSGTWPKSVAPGTHFMFRVELHDIYAAP